MAFTRPIQSLGFGFKSDLYCRHVTCHGDLTWGHLNAAIWNIYVTCLIWTSNYNMQRMFSTIVSIQIQMMCNIFWQIWFSNFRNTGKGYLWNPLWPRRRYFSTQETVGERKRGQGEEEEENVRFWAAPGQVCTWFWPPFYLNMYNKNQRNIIWWKLTTTKKGAEPVHPVPEGGGSGYCDHPWYLLPHRHHRHHHLHLHHRHHCPHHKHLPHQHHL